jgi:hypothetical protein
MNHRFQKHYSLDEARTLLPTLRKWLQQLQEARDWLRQQDSDFEKELSTGVDLGGERVNLWIKHLCQLQRLLREFQSREIQVKDVDRGLIDFPAIMGGREVFLCWEKDEDDIEFWHDLETGYAGRERLK